MESDWPRRNKSHYVTEIVSWLGFADVIFRRNQVTAGNTSAFAGHSRACIATKSFFNILAPRKLGREQKLDESWGGRASPAPTPSIFDSRPNFRLSRVWSFNLSYGTVAMQANLSSVTFYTQALLKEARLGTSRSSETLAQQIKRFIEFDSG